MKKAGKVSGDIRRKQIVQAVLKIVGKRGVGGLTTAVIAREAGVSEANLYRHFKNKDEMLYETGRSIGESFRQNIQAGAVEERASLRILKEMFMRQLDYIERNEGIPRLVFSEEMHISNEQLRKLFIQNLGRNSAGLEALIRAVQGSGAMRSDLDPHSTAFMIIGMVMVTIMRWSLSGFSFSLAAEGRKLWKNFEKCISAAKPSRRQA